MKMGKEKLDKIIAKHKKWLSGERGGERADLSDTDLRRANLSGANLRYANLSDTDLSDANLRRANLSDANLSDTDLRRANLSDADLRRANLSDAALRGANLRYANLSDANLPKIIKVETLFTKIKAAIDNGGELEMSDWHGCKAHCLAGFAITLASDAGRVAETLLGPSCAAALIINESCSYLEGRVPDFISSNKDAMKFIKECAEKEKDLVGQ